MKRFWWRLTFRIDRSLDGCKLKNGAGFRLTRGATGLLATDDTDFITDFICDDDCVPFNYGPVGRCALAHGGEEWIWNVNVAHVKSVVYACQRHDDGGFLSNTR